MFPPVRQFPSGGCLSLHQLQPGGAFWDAHSTTDYEEYLEPTEDVIEIKDRVFEVQVAEDVFQRLRKEATSLRQSVPKVVDEILRKQLP